MTRPLGRVAFAAATASLLALAGLSAAPPGPAAAVPAGVAGAAARSARPWADSSQDPATRAAELLAAMNLPEKVQLLHGVDTSASPVPTVGYIPPIPRLGVPGITMTDGPAGVRNGQPATELPAPIAQAASFDPAVAQAYGSVEGADARALGQDQLFGPGMNIDRVPTNGRNFEYFSEDPLLSGTIGGANVRGIQSHGVIATVKHWVGNNQEANRMQVSAAIPDRALHEIYERNFGIAVAQGNPGSVMCSYNRIDTVYSCSNAETLERDLRGQFGFDGYVVSDYPATHAVTDIADGLNVELPTGVNVNLASVQAALAAGTLMQADIDTRVRETLTVLFRFGLFDRDAQATSPIDAAADEAAAQRIEEQSAVLLKNAGGVLPVQSRSIAVIGATAKTSAQGGGSSQVDPISVDNAYDAIVARAGSSAKVSYDDGSDPAAAAAAARSAGVALVFVRDFSSEGSDRANLSLPNDQDALVSAVAAANPHTVVVLETGAPVLMPWLDRVAGVVEAWYPGARGGAAIARLLAGDVNFSGKLPQTWPASNDQVPASTPEQYPGVDLSETYSEGVEVGYRWYDANDQTPLFPFGAGLSYTSFRYSGLTLSRSSGTSADDVDVSFDVRNTGGRAGSEEPQVYVGKPDRLVPTPPHELAAFGKVTLAPGQTRRVTLTVPAAQLSYWDSGAQAFTVQDGRYSISVGGSSRSLPLSTDYTVTRTDQPTRFTVTGPTAPVQPGSSFLVTGRLANLSDLTVSGVRATVTAPAGWTVTALTPTTFSTGPASSSAPVRWRVTVPADAPGGNVTLTATATGTVAGARRTVTQTLPVVVPFASLAAAVNTVGVSDNADPAAGNLDGGGYSYSAQSLAADGITPGSPVRVGDATLTFPAQPVGTPDVVTAAGQTIRFTGRGSELVFLGTATGSASSGQVGLTYTDGTTGSVTVRFADWYSDPSATLGPVVASGPWNQPTNGIGPHDVNLYGFATAIDPTRTLASITLPMNSALHLFAVGTADPPATAPAAATYAASVNTVGVTDDADPGPGNLDPGGYSLSAQGLAAKGITPGSRVAVDGASVTFPPQAPGTDDAVTAAGQTIAVGAAGSALVLLGTATSGETSALVTVNYADGTRVPTTVAFADWYSNSALPGGTVVVTVPWNQPANGIGPHDVSLYSATVPLRTGKRVVSVTLPTNSRLHLFGGGVR